MPTFSSMRWDRVLWGVCAVLALPTALRPGSALAGTTYLAGMVLIAAGLWWGALRRSGAARRGWSLLASAASCWLAGDTLQRVQAALGLTIGAFDPPDVLWLASYFGLAAGVIVMFRARGLGPAVVAELRLDTVALTAVAAILCWRLMMVPTLQEGHRDLRTFLGLLFPVGDLVVMALLLLLVLAPGRRGMPSLMVVGCLAATFGLDCLYALSSSVLPQLDGERLDAALLVVNALLPAAALHPHGGELAEPPPDGEGGHRMHRGRVLLLGVPLIAVSVAPSLPAPPSALDGTVTALAASVVAASIVARFYRVVREREQAQAALERQATHDQLTGLANRTLLRDRIVAAVLRTGPVGDLDPVPVLLYLDLDGFKAVNDTWGHAAGDLVLQVIADRLRALARTGDTVARLGGDEFAVLALAMGPTDTDRLAERLVRAVAEPIRLDDGTVTQVGVSVGVVRAGPDVGQDAGRNAGQDIGQDAGPAHGPDAGAMPDEERILAAADAAMYLAKAAGGGVRVAAPVRRTSAAGTRKVLPPRADATTSPRR